MATPTELYDQFRQISETGDEEAAKKFLEQHLNEFPEETRDEILFALFEDSLVQQANAVNENTLLKEHGIAALDTLQSAKKELENDLRVEELKDTLGAK